MNSIKMDFIDGAKMAKQIRESFSEKIFLEANIAWEEAIKAFVRTAVENTLIDTAMSAVSLITPLDEINTQEASAIQNEIMSKRKRIKAKPLRQSNGQILKGAFRDALSAFQLAKMNTKVLELDFKNPYLQFKYKVVVWQISFIMGDEPVKEGFKAFEEVLDKNFLNFEKNIKINSFLNPFLTRKTITRITSRE